MTRSGERVYYSVEIPPQAGSADAKASVVVATHRSGGRAR